ncbi:adenylyl-sulfate kinase [Saprospiraceae bacterium]|nr:adenylyl-sulfate kinase [Saprospiraceae bacterium]
MFTLQTTIVQLKKINNLFLLFTGFSGAGKSTIAQALRVRLAEEGLDSYILDGDNMRNGLCNDLSFSAEDRKENMRRTAHVSTLFMDAGLIAIAAMIAPYAEEREGMKEIIGAKNFVEVFVSTSIEVCIKRDTKGLYKKALNGEITNMTGIQAPYEKPVSADLIFDTNSISLEEITNKILTFIKKRLA